MTSLKVDQSSSVLKTFTVEEVDIYCKHISGDANLVHVDEQAAREMGFEHCIVPGIMTSSLFGGLLGTTLPGPGTIHLGQQTRFIKPVYVGEAVTATVRITSVREDKPIATLYCCVIKENGEMALEGEAVVKYPKATV